MLVYISDIYTGIAMLANGYWSANILSESDESSTISVPFKIGKWIFVGCIIFSLLLLAWEARKARMIIRSRDISYAFTNLMANDYYCLKSYDHFCFFSQINNSKKKKDEIAFFVFFTFKGERGGREPCTEVFRAGADQVTCLALAHTHARSLLFALALW